MEEKYPTQHDTAKIGVETDDLGDWRIGAVARLASDVLAAYPGGPSHKAGAPVYLSTVTKSKEHGTVSFCTPSATALALDLAMQAGSMAYELRQKIIMESAVTPTGPGKQVRLENLDTLYKYLEQCMVAATFSFQALEAFCNHTIAHKMKNVITLTRRRGDETMTAEEVERNVSTEEKLATVLPQILAKASPKGGREWTDFVKLKEARDATVHLKSHDQYPRSTTPDDSTLFYYFLNNDVRAYPRAAVAMISYFRITGEDMPRWLNHLMQVLLPERATGASKRHAK